MSAGGAFGGSRGVKPVPPEKGVFPLDHLHECRSAMQEYMQCLKNNQMLVDRCKFFSKRYLECRMERSLMHKQDLKELGFKENEEEVYTSKSRDEEYESLLSFMNQPRKEGHIAGLRRKRVDKPQEEEDMIN